MFFNRCTGGNASSGNKARGGVLTAPRVNSQQRVVIAFAARRGEDTAPYLPSPAIGVIRGEADSTTSESVRREELQQLNLFTFAQRIEQSFGHQ